MKKNNYKLENVDCAACGLKLEESVSKLDGVFSCDFNFVFMKFHVEFDEEIVNDEEIEIKLHKSISGVKIIEKNNKPFVDTYEEPKKLRKLFGNKKSIGIYRFPMK